MTNETTKIVRRKDGLYDLTIRTGRELISKSGLSMQEVANELEQIYYQKEESDGGDEQ